MTCIVADGAGNGKVPERAPGGLPDRGDRPSLGPIGPRLCKMAYTNFHEKAHFVKPTWRPCMAERSISLYPSRYASIRTVSEFTLW